MRLYDRKLSGNCYKVRLLLAHLGLPYDCHEVELFEFESRQKRLGDKNPSGRVPILELDDGRTLGESNAILCYLAQGTPYLPDDAFQRAQVLQWLFFEQNLHEPNIAVLRSWRHQGTETGHSEEHRQARLTQGNQALQTMERHLRSRNYLVGDHCTIADFGLYAYTHVAPEGGFPLDEYPSVRAWIERIEKLAGHVPMLAGR